MIVLGDFNAVANKDMDGSRLTTSAEIPQSIHAWLEEVELVDIWRMKHPYEKDYTFFSHRF